MSTGRCGAGVVCPTGAGIYPAACPVHEPNGCENPVTAPPPTAAVPDPADVEKVARAIFDAANPITESFPDYWGRVAGGEDTRDHYRRLAVAALAALRPSPDSEAHRLRAAMRDLADELKRDAYGPFGSYDESYAYAADRIRAALGTDAEDAR